ncbi:MAG: hypothetical protein PHC88_16860 [Terrimicrobiaceae bacterium]|nr:hypothetical protein [Terrimicrobiaceae bacterium]
MTPCHWAAIEGDLQTVVTLPKRIFERYARLRRAGGHPRQRGGFWRLLKR